MNNPKYKIIGRRYDTASGRYDADREITPIFSDDISLKYTLNDGERYYKPSFDGTFIFVNSDYNWVIQAPGSTLYIEYQMDIMLRQDNSVVCSVKFVITDCEVDEDNGIITVKPSIKTVYDDVNNGKEIEYDLIQLNPIINSMSWYRRAILQMYEYGADNLTNYINAIHWVQDTNDAPENINMLSAFGFAESDAFAEATIIKNTSGTYDGVVGAYFGRASLNYQSFDYSIASLDNQLFYINIIGYYAPAGPYGMGIYVKNMLGETVLYYEAPFTQIISSITTERMKYYSSDNLSPYYITLNVKRYYARILCNKKHVNGHDTIHLTDADILPLNKNYQYATPYAQNGTIVQRIIKSSLRYSDTPTEYGIAPNGQYYMPPDDNSYRWYPVSMENWGRASLWLDYDVAYYNDENERQKVTLHHAYPLWSCIKVLLNEIAPAVAFDNTTEYSEFLFADQNPVIQEENVQLFITPKSNIITGDYKTPAYKAPVKLKDILDMLQKVYKCYWFIDNQNRFRIEHISWFMNGGNYNTNHILSYDLSTMREIRNGKSWAFAKNKYKFNKLSMAASYNFNWMDEVTQEFKGWLMTADSPLVDKSKNDEVRIEKFTSDIDYVALVPADVSKDGFMLFAANFDVANNEYVTSFLPVTHYPTIYTSYIQNGILSFEYLEKSKLQLCDIPAPKVHYFDGTTCNVFMQSRARMQEAEFPLVSPSIDPIMLIRTGLGDGEISSIEINLSSLKAKTTLKYELQQQP